MIPLGDEPDAAWLLASPLTLARLAAFGSVSLFADRRRTLRTLPANSSARALSVLRWRARDAGRLLRLVIEEPGHPIAPAAAREVAKLFAEWPALAAAVHAEFGPLLRAPPFRLHEHFDAVGLPNAVASALRRTLETDKVS